MWERSFGCKQAKLFLDEEVRVLITRSREDAAHLMRELDSRNIQAILAPLLTITYLAGSVVNLEGVQALLMTSVNGVRAFSARSEERGLLVVAVGDATARAAKGYGFDNVISAAGDVNQLARTVISTLKPENGALLHPAGTRVAGSLGTSLGDAGYVYRRVVLYEAKMLEQLPTIAVDGLNNGVFDGVLIYSPRTGKTFNRLIHENNLADTLFNVTVYCLSANVAETVSNLPWDSVLIASRPEQSAILELFER